MSLSFTRSVPVRAEIAALLVAIAAIVVQIATGVKYGAVPPGPIILAATAVLLALVIELIALAVAVVAAVVAIVEWRASQARPEAQRWSRRTSRNSWPAS